MKVSELASELGIPSKDLIQRLSLIGIRIKDQADVLPEETVKRIRTGFRILKKKTSEPSQPAEKGKTVAKKTETTEKAQKTKKKTEETKPVKIEKSAAEGKKKADTPAEKKPKKTAKKVESKAKPKVEKQPLPEAKPAPKVEPVHKEPPVSVEKKSVPKIEVKKRTSPPVDASSVSVAPAVMEAEKEIKEAAAPVTAREIPVKEVPAPVVKREPIRIGMPITVGALADAFRVRPAELIKQLIEIGVFANINQLLNEEIVFKISAKVSMPVEKLPDEAEKVFAQQKESDPTKLKFRPPVVTMMGHVDHGKTSLLDAIRKTNVASGEAGLITQHIGAYVVELPGKGRVTFLDTPGHEAFTAIRARGANVTDVVVLVVAADDGIKPQTMEAIDHARAAGCPIIVAMNKCDLPNANPQRVMAQLQKIDLVPEEWGGKTICVKVSAKTGDGIDQLLEMLLLESEVLELKANPDCEAQGTILEAKLTKGSGAVSTTLIQRGTLRVGDTIVAGPYYGKVRAMRSDLGKSVKEAGPSYAVEVLGLSGVPVAGELFCVIKDEKMARKLAEKRELEMREREMKGLHARHLSLQELYSKMKDGHVKELRLIIKADVQGSVEALTQMLERVSAEKIAIRIIHGGVGGINESDVMLAVASDAVLIGFHVKADPRAQQLIDDEGIDARFYSIVYNVVEDVQKAMEGLLEPVYKEVIQGRAEIRKIYQSSKHGTIGGAVVTKGKVFRASPVRLIRDNIVVFEGKFDSLKRFKDDVREVQEGYDCGVVLAGFNDLQERDIVESYRLDKVAGKLV